MWLSALFIIPIITIVIVFIWINSELRANKGWTRITFGSLAILCSWGVAVLAAQIVRLEYNIWYSDATKKLITTTVKKLEAGENDLVIKELKKLQEKLHPRYEIKGNYDELVKEAIKDMNATDKGNPLISSTDNCDEGKRGASF